MVELVAPGEERASHALEAFVEGLIVLFKFAVEIRQSHAKKIENF